MASTSNHRVLLKYGIAGQLEGVALTTAGSQALKANPTLAAGDVKVSKDGGALTNIATLPAATPAASALLRFSFSATELSCKELAVLCIDAAGAEWEDLAFVVETFGHPNAKHPLDLDATGFVLAPNGLDAVQAPADITSDTNMRSSFLGMFRGLFNRWFNEVTATSTQAKVKNDGGSVVATMSLSNDSTTVTKGKSS